MNINAPVRPEGNRTAQSYRRVILKRVVWIVSVSIAVFLVAALLLIALVGAGLFGKIPDNEELLSIRHPVASEVYSADSVLLGRYYLQERAPARADELPEGLKAALIATEDVRFYEHHGIDVRSLMRVLVKSVLLQQENAGGGSTLTQQLAKNLYPRQQYAVWSLPINKIRECIIARKLEKLYAKDDLLLLYLNTIPFADNTYGIKTAADRFFSTDVKKLTVPQAAVLVGMLKATHDYNPRLFPERSLKRRNRVIAQMEKYGFITPDESKTFQAQPLELKYNNGVNHEGTAPYFRAYIRNELMEWCKANKKPDGTSYNLFTDGLKIYTTIDSRLQRYAEKAVKEQMKLLQPVFARDISNRTLNEAVMEALRRLPQYNALKMEGLSETDIIVKLKAPALRKVFTWEGLKEAEMSVYDSVKHHLQFLQAGLLAMHPGTGEIKAWVGGIDHRFFQYDHVRESTKRQVGSTLKPVLYAAALEHGIPPCGYITARKTAYTNEDNWTPGNTDDKTYDLKYSMQGALAASVNTVSVKLLEKTGIRNTIAVARKMGITSDLPEVPSLALGTPSISMMEMVTAYSVLANFGKRVTPRWITTVTDWDGNILYRQTQPDGKEERVLSVETAKLMVQMLKGVINEGTGAALRTRYGITNDIAGKTGTTQNNVDGWFIVISPDLVTGVWVGADDPRLHFRSTAQGQGAATALPIVAKFLQMANDDKQLKPVMRARFEPLPEHLFEKLDCNPYRSDRNIFERIFKIRRQVKEKKFKRKEQRK